MTSPREYQAISPSRPDIERTGVHHWITSSADARSRFVRPAFLNCLAAYCTAHRDKLVLVPELAASKGTRTDGTVRDALRMGRSNWEARDNRGFQQGGRRLE